MIVTEDNFRDCLNEIISNPEASLDTETTGLEVYKKDELFSIIIGTESETFYFNFNAGNDHLGNPFPNLLPRTYIAEIARAIETMGLLYMANAKFDMGMIDKEFEIQWPAIHDVLVIDRLLFSDQMKINLNSVAKRNGFEKLDIVEDYIKEHKLYETRKVPHKKTKEKLKFYNLVPWDVIVPYAIQDAKITFSIGRIQREKIKVLEPKNGVDPYLLELETTKTLYAMERRGIYTDENYINTRRNETLSRIETRGRYFHDQTRQVFIDSSKALAPLFLATGHIPPKTEKDNDSISDEWLGTINTPLGNLVKELRHAHKEYSFYSAYQYYSVGGIIHANVNQAGTRTGRLSMSNPNLQQAPDSDVRKSFSAPEGFDMASLDFDQQEYRMMLEYAEEMELIAQVKGGLDVHTATANLAGISRQEAKTLNFMLLYGGGTVKLCLALFKPTTTEPILWVIWKQENGWKLEAEDKKWLDQVTPELVAENLPELYKAEELRAKYFERLPAVKKLISRCREVAKSRGYITTWTGRRLHFKSAFSYKAPNGLIQGGASDVIKVAMNRIEEELRGCQSYLTASIHDEIVLTVHKSERDVIGRVKNIMETSFPAKLLPLTVGAAIGKNLFEMEKYNV